MSQTISNWGRNVKFNPKQINYPTTEADVIDIVKAARQQGRKIRCIGSGHSWTRLIETNDILVSLDNMQGIVSIDKANNRATVWAGTKIKKAGELLFENGLGQENLGDIDVQSLAGALSTGTHGTGKHLRTIAAQLHAITFVNGSGELIECSEESNVETFKAAQVALGSLGVITKLTYNLMPAYKLHYISGKETLDNVLQNLERYKEDTRNFEFYWFPHTNTVQTKFSNITTEEVTTSGFMKYLSEVVLENKLFYVLSEISRIFPFATKAISKISAWGVSKANRIDWAHRIYATERSVRFLEMEYNFPAENFEQVIREIQRTISEKNIRVHFPLECRFVKSDDILISPAYQRESAYIAVHQYLGIPHLEYFKEMEEIFMKYGGRPHWGKMHTRKADYLSTVYPQWNAFKAIRETNDPNQLFINPHLAEVLGV